MPIFFIAVFSILCSVAAQFALKAGMSSPKTKTALDLPFGIETVVALVFNRHLVLGFALYGLGAVVWLLVLAKWDVSKAYPLVGLGFIVTLLVGFWLGEQVSWDRVLGCCLICLGIYLVVRS
jgi:drug/metabolite transporter (DMT)-like permease